MAAELSNFWDLLNLLRLILLCNCCKIFGLWQLDACGNPDNLQNKFYFFL
jgi:hypothetical protein